MDWVPSRIRRAANNAWLVVSSCICSIAGLVITIALAIWPDLLKNLPNPDPFFYGVVVLSALLLVISTILVFQNWQDARAIRLSYSKIHQINHAYRDALARILFHRDWHGCGTGTSFAAYVNSEVDTLGVVLGKIAGIYRELIGAPCMATVKLNAKKGDQDVCFAIARSERGTERDKYGEDEFVISENTGFTVARKIRPDGRASHFYSGDLCALRDAKEYENKRPNWDSLYKSCIVVPIRYCKQADTGQSRDIGFLCIDTKARNRLNVTFHVELLAAFADQLYNFLNLSRASLLKEILHEVSEATSKAPA